MLDLSVGAEGHGSAGDGTGKRRERGGGAGGDAARQRVGGAVRCDRS